MIYFLFIYFFYFQVFKGKFRENEVAIKVFKSIDFKSIEEFKKEFIILSTIPHHPNIMKFFGACLEPKICMITEVGNFFFFFFLQWDSFVIEGVYLKF
jgi:hypothetical protein